MGRFITAALVALVLLGALASDAHGGCHSQSCQQRVWVKAHIQHTALASVYEDGGPCSGGYGKCPTASGYTRRYGVAHKTLKLGTTVRICYRRCVTATVDDRGPYVGAREFDLNMNVMRATGFPYGVAVIRWRIWHPRLDRKGEPRMKAWKKSGRKRASIKTQKPRRLKLPGFVSPRPPRNPVISPSQEKWDEILLAAKKRRKGDKGLIAIAQAEGFALTGDDPKERTHWRKTDV